MSLAPRVVLVTRATEFHGLQQRHATSAQADFFLRSRGQTLEAVQSRHQQQAEAVERVMAAVPLDWRRNHVQRDDLPRFLFTPEDIVVVIGQDGLVANVAKYLDGQPVLGVQPSPGAYEGILVPLDVATAVQLIAAAAHGEIETEARTMVEARLDDGQTLHALNEVFLGHRSHQSARYVVRHRGVDARHSSSGIIVSTGTGASGWARSITRERRGELHLPGPTDRRLAYFVREAFPSVSTSVELTEGIVDGEVPLEVISRMDEGGVVFGDGIESDGIRFDWGMRAEIRISPKQLKLATPRPNRALPRRRAPR